MSFSSGLMWMSLARSFTARNRSEFTSRMIGASSSASRRSVGSSSSWATRLEVLGLEALHELVVLVGGAVVDRVDGVERPPARWRPRGATARAEQHGERSRARRCRAGRPPPRAPRRPRRPERQHARLLREVDRHLASTSSAGTVSGVDPLQERQVELGGERAQHVLLGDAPSCAPGSRRAARPRARRAARRAPPRARPARGRRCATRISPSGRPASAARARRRRRVASARGGAELDDVDSRHGESRENTRRGALHSVRLPGRWRGAQAPVRPPGGRPAGGRWDRRVLRTAAGGRRRELPPAAPAAPRAGPRRSGGAARLPSLGVRISAAGRRDEPSPGAPVPPFSSLTTSSSSTSLRSFA